MRIHVTLPWPLLRPASPRRRAFLLSADCSRVPPQHRCVRAASSLPAGRRKPSCRQGWNKFYCASPKGRDASWNGNAFITYPNQATASCSSLSRAAYLTCALAHTNAVYIHGLLLMSLTREHKWKYLKFSDLSALRVGWDSGKTLDLLGFKQRTLKMEIE